MAGSTMCEAGQSFDMPNMLALNQFTANCIAAKTIQPAQLYCTGDTTTAESDANFIKTSLVTFYTAYKFAQSYVKHRPVLVPGMYGDNVDMGYISSIMTAFKRIIIGRPENQLRMGVFQTIIDNYVCKYDELLMYMEIPSPRLFTVRIYPLPSTAQLGISMNSELRWDELKNKMVWVTDLSQEELSPAIQAVFDSILKSEFVLGEGPNFVCLKMFDYALLSDQDIAYRVSKKLSYNITRSSMAV